MRNLTKVNSVMLCEIQAVNIAQHLKKRKKRRENKKKQTKLNQTLIGGSPSSLQIFINYLLVGSDTKIISLVLELEISCC